MESALLLLVALAAIVEPLVTYTFPVLLAPFARLPLGIVDREVALPRERLLALAASGAAASSGYRGGPDAVVGLALHQLPLPSELVLSGGRISPDLARGRVMVVAEPFGRSMLLHRRGIGGVVRVDLSHSDGVVAMRARFVPSPLITVLLLFFVVGQGVSFSLLAWGMAAVFVLVTHVSARLVLQPLTFEAMNRLELALVQDDDGPRGGTGRT